MQKLLKIFFFILLFQLSYFSESQALKDKFNLKNIEKTQLSTAEELQKLEDEIVKEINKVRTNPPLYADEVIKSIETNFRDGKYHSHNKIYPTKEGISAVRECYNFLINTKPITPLTIKNELKMAAKDLVIDHGLKGIVGHIGTDKSSPLTRVRRYINSDKLIIGENISYGMTDAKEITAFFLINDGSPSRSHRQLILSPKFTMIGVSCGYHTKYNSMCVVVFADVK
ncbi:MAG: CAP domain-containing protein [Thermodesulfovibrionales bacterium]|nr:CAP domain-containing protein [Thermodesulfovibrionales bacterium]